MTCSSTAMRAAAKRPQYSYSALATNDERAYDRNAGRVGGDGVVDGLFGEEGHRWAAHVVGGPSDGPSSGTG